MSSCFALSSAQQGLWYAQHLDPSNPIFNTAHYADIQSPLDVSLFTQAVNRVLEQADVLRLRLCIQDDMAQQCFDGPQPVLEVHTACSTAEEALAHMRADQQQALDLRYDSAARFILFVLNTHHFIFYMRVHHLAADGYAMNLLETRILQHYLALTEGKPCPAPLSSIHDVLADDQRYLHSPKYQKDRDFWLEQLQPDLDVASLASTTALSAHTFLAHHQPVSTQWSQKLLQFCATHQYPWPDVLTLLSAVYIARHTGQYDSVFGVPYMGRMGNQSALAIATVMNVAPLPLQIDEQLSVPDFLHQGMRALMRTRRHGRYRSEQLRRDLGLLGEMRRLHGPLINILPFDTPYDQTPLHATSHVLCAGPVEDLNITFRAGTQAQGMRLEIEANPKLYSLDMLQAHGDRLLTFIEKAWDAPTLQAIPTLTPSEHHYYVHTLNHTEHPVPATTLNALIANTVSLHAQRAALSDDNHSYTYTQYQKRVETLCLQLYQAGVRRGDIVAVGMTRRAERVLLLHAILRAGAAYLPLDLSQPPARLINVLQQAQPVLCISDTTIVSADPLPCPTLPIEALPSAAPHLRLQQIESAHATDAAYVLFTSGSTGDPKGVVVSHQAIVNRLLWMREHYAIQAGTRFIQKTPYTFDVSLWELFLPFISGAHLYVAPPEAHKDPQQLAQLVCQHHIEVIHFVPSMLAAFLADASSQGLSIPLVFCSGEALPAYLRDRFYTHIQGQLHNLYGPTEAAVDVSYWHASAQDQSDPIPIGFPVWNTALYILDEQLRPVPAGVSGDLYISGVQLADGYLGRPDLTAASFIPHPFATGRIYRTGDKARWRTDGAVEYLGRADFQVKLRGLRIELEEIEQILQQHPAVQHSVALVREDQPGQQLLVAYVVLTTPTNPEDLLEQCRQYLPDYMVPNHLVILDTLPLNRSGKLDRKALPAPARQNQAGTLPTTATQQQITTLFQQVLQLQHPVYIEDNFFRLGGHSLLAAQLIAQLRQSYPELNLGAIFAHPSVAQLAHYLDHELATRTHSAGFEPVLALHQGNSQRPALFCIHPAGGLSWCYGALARADLDQRSVYGLQADTFHNESTSQTHLDTMAQRYADRIQALQPTGPYHLLGWSVGGILAHAVGVTLQRRGECLGLICLLDAYPSSAWRAQPLPAANAIYKALLHIAGFDPNELPHVALTRQSVIDFLRQQNHPLGALDNTQLNGVFEAVALNNAAVREHQEQKLHAKVLYIQAGLDHKDTDLNPAMWQPWVEQLYIHTLPFLHAHLTGPEASAQIAPLLKHALQQSETHPTLSMES